MRKLLRINDPQFNGNEEKYVIDCLRSGWVSIRGDYVKKLEQQFRDMTGRRYAVAVNSGTAALHVALLSVGVRPGDNVLCPVFSCPATVTSVRQIGATPIFADMEVDTLGVDVSSIPKNVKLKAAQLVHVYGQRARDTKKLADMCQKKGIKLIVDAAEAHGLDVRGVGDVVTYSLRSEKLVGIGEGGMICTDNPEIYANVLMYAERGIPSQGVRYWVAEVGCNYLMPNLPAAVGVAQMETLKDRIKKKREIAQWYREEMPEEQWVADPRTCDGVFWLNCLVLRENDLEGRDFIQAAYAEQVECRPGFYPLNMLPVGDSSQKCPTAAKIWRRLVCLPSSVLMDREDVRRVCRTFERITCRKSSWR